MVQTKKAKPTNKTKKVTLKRIESKAIADPKFWKSLRKDAQRTLAENGMQLGAADARRLKQILGLHGKAVVVDLDRLMERARTGPRFPRPGPGWVITWKLSLTIVPPVFDPVVNPKVPRSGR